MIEKIFKRKPTTGKQAKLTNRYQSSNPTYKKFTNHQITRTINKKIRKLI